VTARYRVRPYGGTFDEAAAHRFGLEAANDAPLLQQMGEPHGESLLPASGSLLQLPQPPVVVLHVKPAYDGSGALVRLLNASDTAQNATIGSGLVQIGSAVRCDLLENELGPLEVENGAVQLTLQPRATAAVLIRK
jgi:alpha-mannosidase